MSVQPMTPSPPRPIRHEIPTAQETGSYTGWSAKMRRPMFFDNQLEFHHWLLLEGDPQAEQLCEQYPEADLDTETHVFDMWIRWRDRREECRDVVPTRKFDVYQGHVADPPGWSGYAGWGSQHGYHCRYVTEQELDARMVRILNWRRMLPFVQRAVEAPVYSLEQHILEQMQLVHDISLGRLILAQDMVDPADVAAVAAKLLHEGKLHADLDHYRFGGTLLLSPTR